MAWSPSIKQVKAVRLRSASNFPLELLGTMTTELKMLQLQKDVGFHVGSDLVASSILETTIIGQHNEGISPETGPTTPSASSPITVLDETHRGPFVLVSAEKATENSVMQQMSTQAWSSK